MTHEVGAAIPRAGPGGCLDRLDGRRGRAGRPTPRASRASATQGHAVGETARPGRRRPPSNGSLPRTPFVPSAKPWFSPALGSAPRAGPAGMGPRLRSANRGIVIMVMQMAIGVWGASAR